jgi:glyoxylase-like metal-dependent hydrolase (beta-lactamase superfamily II)
MLPLEDNVGDVIGKARRGTGLDDAALARATGISGGDLRDALDGRADDAAYLAIAAALGLHGPSLAGLARGAWHPRPVELEGLHQATTRFGEMAVNAYLLWDPVTREAAAFDTGTDAGMILAFAASRSLRIGALFLTHSHPDHIAAMGAFVADGIPVRCPESEPVPGALLFPVGEPFAVGGLRVETRPTTGHTRGGVSYVVTGLPRIVAVVGDAIFAGSMGGARHSYREALATNRASLFTLPDDAILAPGHGPLTTVAEEKRHNPFFPEFKPAG